MARPKKVIPTGSSQITMDLPNEIIALMDATMAVRGIKYRGVFVREAIELYASLASLSSQKESELAEMRRMFREMHSANRIIATQVADLARALEVDIPEADEPPEFNPYEGDEEFAEGENHA